MKPTFLFVILFMQSLLLGQNPSGKALLEKIDQNLSAANRIATTEMIIHGRRGSRTVLAKTWGKGERTAFTEYLAPARDKGTKMLKLKDKLWIYSPSTDRIIQISGNMLRQSVMGSDLSYEDMMEDPRLVNHYQAAVTGTDTIDARACWRVELTANTKDVAYQIRKLWVDKERNIPLKEELYAKSGKLLKKVELKEITKIQGRWYPKRFIFKDMLKRGEGTEFVIQDIQFNVKIPRYIFTKAALKK